MANVTERAWGHYIDHLRTDECVFKTLYIGPGEGTSAQLHHHRREHWIVTAGEGVMHYRGNTVRVGVGSEATIEKKDPHWIKNTGDITLVVREMQTGYCSEDDIERF